MKKLSIALIAIFILMYASSCKKEDGKLRWETDLLTPIATSDLSISNLVGKDRIGVNSDNSLKLVYRNPLYTFDFSNYLLQIPDTGIGSKFSIDSFNLGEQFIKLKLTMGEMALGLIRSGTSLNVLIGNQLIANHHRTMIFPALSGLSTPPTVFDASFYFSSADLTRGYLGGYIRNNFPVALTNVEFELKNAVGGDVLIHDIIPNIPAHAAYYVEYSLAGKHLESSFTIQMVNFNTPGSGGIALPVDTSDFIMLDLKAWGLRASRATAIFPRIDVISTTQELTQDIGNAKLTYLETESGLLHVYLTSSVQEGLYLTYILEGAYDPMGRPLIVTSFVPPAPAGSLSRVDRVFDLSGYSISLTGKDHDKFNTYTQTINARIDSSGVMRTITSADSLRISYSLENIRPKLIKGYAGNDTIHVGPERSAFDFFNIIQAGTISLEDAKVSLSLENGIGVAGDVVIKEFKAGKNSTEVALVAPSVINNRIHVPKATEIPFSPATSSITLNNSNSNIKSMIELLPNMLQYGMDVYVNPAGNDGSYQDFVKSDSRLKVNLDFELPLSLEADNLTLKDTMDFALASTLDKLNSIKEGSLNLIANNGYPMEAVLDFVVYDETFGAVDTLLKSYKVTAADMNTSCRVTESKKSVAKLAIDQNRMTQLKAGRKAIVVVRFSTRSNQPACNSYLKIYSDYQLNLKLTGDFRYDLHANF